MKAIPSLSVVLAFGALLVSCEMHMHVLNDSKVDESSDNNRDSNPDSSPISDSDTDTDIDADTDTDNDLGPDSELQADGIEINFSEKLGSPTYQASGFIYGLSPDASRPAEHFASDIKTQYLRVGGARLNCPNGGWVNGDYTRRWDAVSAYYQAAERIGATLIVMLHDLWGADLECTINEYPGDDGDWTRFEQFMDQVIGEATADGMTGSNVHFDLWSGPDCCNFWEPIRSEEQYLETWTRTFHKIREALPDTVIVGPSSSEASLNENSWLARFLDHVQSDDVVPDILSWQQLGKSDVRDSKNIADGLLAERGISVDSYQVNVYGQYGAEHGAGCSAWYISRLDRLGIAGARANYGTYGGLWDAMGELVMNQDGAYQPLGAWWVYKRYADMTGTMVGTVSTETEFDAVASTDPDKANAIVVLGSREAEGAIPISFSHFSQAAYLVEDGRVRVVLEQIPETNGVPVPEPEVIHDEMHPLMEGNWFTMEVNFENNNAYVVILGPGGI